MCIHTNRYTLQTKDCGRPWASPSPLTRSLSGRVGYPSSPQALRRSGGRAASRYQHPGPLEGAQPPLVQTPWRVLPPVLVMTVSPLCSLWPILQFML